MARAHISKSERYFNVKFATYYFHMHEDEDIGIFSNLH